MNLNIGLILFNIPLAQTSGSCRYVSDLASALIKSGAKVTIFTNWSSDRRHIIDLKKKRGFNYRNKIFKFDDLAKFNKRTQ